MAGVSRTPVLAIGGTRGTGRLVAERLHDASRSVRVLARNPAQARRSLPAGIDIVAGDLTRPDSLQPALSGVAHIVFTAGIRSGYPALEARVRAVEFDGVRHALAAALATCFAGRFVYMNSMGADVDSLPARLLNLYKGNALRWRRQGEDEIRRSGLDYAIVRAGFLLNAGGGRRALLVSQHPLPLAVRYRISRADVAATLVACIEHPAASRVTFELAWAPGPQTTPVESSLSALHRDAPTRDVREGSVPERRDEHA
jgi:uncharacterized protein YbjT (DUF2867 family)